MVPSEHAEDVGQLLVHDHSDLDRQDHETSNANDEANGNGTVVVGQSRVAGADHCEQGVHQEGQGDQCHPSVADREFEWELLEESGRDESQRADDRERDPDEGSLDRVFPEVLKQDWKRIHWVRCTELLPTSRS